MVFAYSVLRLADEGKVDLDKPIAGMLAKPLPDYGNLDAYGHWGDLAGDERWRAITPRMVLNHSTGFANFHFLEPDGKLRIHFDPGSRYGYSGEGIMLLQFGLDEGLGLDTGKEVQRLVFDPLRMPNSAAWSGAPISRPIWPMAEELDGKAVPHDERGRVRAAGSMDTTIADLANFAAALVSGEGFRRRRAPNCCGRLSRSARVRNSRQLGEDAPATEQPVGVASSVGLITFSGPQGSAFSAAGTMIRPATRSVCLEKAERCVLIMSNDVRAEAAFPMIVRDILGETGAPWRWIFGDMKFVSEVAARSRSGSGRHLRSVADRLAVGAAHDDRRRARLFARKEGGRPASCRSDAGY